MNGPGLVLFCFFLFFPFCFFCLFFLFWFRGASVRKAETALTRATTPPQRPNDTLLHTTTHYTRLHGTMRPPPHHHHTPPHTTTHHCTSSMPTPQLIPVHSSIPVIPPHCTQPFHTPSVSQRSSLKPDARLTFRPEPMSLPS